MQLTQFTDYSLRTLIFVGMQGDQRVAIDDMVQSFAMSRSQLTKVVHFLGQHDFLRTIRGKNGGILLGKKPEQINIADVVRLCEPQMNLLECFDAETSACPLTDRCRLQGILNRALHAFMAELEQFTLADLLQDESEIRQLLKL